ncbi:hypothetical protein psyc5s11_51200 [Clostridium gelidum]|uniref:Transposase n=1 Tax=Clostridium gelidum TaxID=704125 RepID=A0ABM7TCL7_9CLOT|nr:hypothetical protein psyc5s11_51200 [Clostridium gelidum]
MNRCGYYLRKWKCIYLFLAIEFDKGESLYDINVKNKVSYIKVCVEQKMKIILLKLMGSQ